ncbi:MAG: molybdenum cofactor biosynthesis protein MoaE [Nitrososphaerales archaeon]
MISITRDPIDLCNILVNAKDRSSGGTVLFIGSVRDHNEKGSVSEIYYEAYKEMAEEKIAEIEDEVRKRWNVRKFVAIHRIGNLRVGEPSVAVAVSSEHRKEAFEACKYGIDEIKTRVPIWKKEVSASSTVWVEGVSPKSD